jgi:hypothetical protein
MVVIYVTVIVSQGGNDVGDIAPWALAMAAAAMLALVGANLEADRGARTLLLVSAVMYLGLGVISILTIGLGLLAAGAMALFGANQIPRSG